MAGTPEATPTINSRNFNATGSNTFVNSGRLTNDKKNIGYTTQYINTPFPQQSSG